MKLTEQWSFELDNWGIPQDILSQAPESPWIHPPTLFEVPAVIPETPSHARAREALTQGGTVLDIGCGGGLAAFALTPPASRVIGVDHQAKMLDMFAVGAMDRGLIHEEFLGDWPDVEKHIPIVDVVTCHNVAYNVRDIEPFVLALARHARKRVVMEVPQQHPLMMMSGAWKKFWNLDRPSGPTAEQLCNIVISLGFDAHIELWNSDFVREISFEDQVRFARIRLCLPSSRDAEIADYLKSEPKYGSRPTATIWWD